MGSYRRIRSRKTERQAPNPHDAMYHLKAEGDEEYYVLAARSPLMAPLVLLHAALMEKDFTTAQTAFEACLGAAIKAERPSDDAILYAVDTADRAKEWHDKNILGIGAGAEEEEVPPQTGVQPPVGQQLGDPGGEEETDEAPAESDDEPAPPTVQFQDS